jgi:hypothetical protein
MLKSTWFWMAINLLALAVLTTIGPAEKTLGNNVRVVYLHGAWVWSALVGFIAAGLVGLLGLITRLKSWQRLSRALGRTGLLFWVTYLPISMWAMQTNWNGMFLAEPRFRVAVIFAIGGLLLQLGSTIADDPAWDSAVNIGYISALLWALGSSQNIMHPPSPIVNSDSWRIQAYFFGLVFLTLLLAAQIARLIYRADAYRMKPYKALKIDRSQS